MVLTHYTKNHGEEAREGEKLSHESQELLLSLPKEKGWRTPYLYKYQGFWCQPMEIQATVSFQKHFLARDTDVVLATIPKSGTTWLKALAFAIVNRKRFPISNNHPLLSYNPHDLVPSLSTSFMQMSNFLTFPTFPTFHNLDFLALMFHLLLWLILSTSLAVGLFIFVETHLILLSPRGITLTKLFQKLKPQCQ